MAIDYANLAKNILTNVGGEDNVAAVVHCATRLRVTLKDRGLADTDTIEALPGVLGIVENGNQIQIVIGPKVPKLYAKLPTSLRG